jgi:site-specific recombinase XerD
MNTTHQTSAPLMQEDCLEIALEGFLVSRKSENVAEGTIRYYREKLTKFNAFCLSQEIKQVSQIVPNTIREYLLFVRNKGNSDGNVHAHFRAIKAFLRWYEREFEPEGWTNPISKVKAPKVALEPLEPVAFEVVEKMMRACDNNLIGRRDKAMMLTLLDTGARANELLAIQLDEIDILTGQVFIRKGKGRKPRTVYLGEKSRKAVRRYLSLRNDNSPAVWITKAGEPLSYWGLVAVMRRRSEQAKVPTPSIHSFRYAFALASLRNGMDVFSLQKAGGWASMAVMRRYLKQTEADVEAAMKKFSPVDNLSQL